MTEEEITEVLCMEYLDDYRYWEEYGYDHASYPDALEQSVPCY